MAVSNQQQVMLHLQKMEPILREMVNMIRGIILTTDDSIAEQVKWNNISFYYSGEMRAFNPKEYKRDIAVFNLHKNRIMLVFPTGVKADDPSGLLEGDYKDGRKLLIFKSSEDVKIKAPGLTLILRSWLNRVER